LYPIQDAWRLAKENVQKALSLDSTLSEAYVTLAYIERTHDWNWKQAEKHQLKAMQGNTKNRVNYSILLGAMGRFEESLAQGKRDLALDPLNPQGFVDVARMYYYAGKINEALKLAQSSLDLEPGYRPALGLIGCILENQAKPDSAVLMISRSSTRTGTDYEGADENFRTTPAPYKEYWNDVLSRTLNDAKTRRIPSIIMAILYMRTDNREKALSALEKAYQDHEGGMVYVNVEPLFKPLHTDPRFKRIVSGMGLIVSQ
jgi:tetratricopeptide (TPR) repeat protein